MTNHALGAIELALVVGGVIAWGWWELRSLSRARREAARRKREAGEPGD